MIAVVCNKRYTRPGGPVLTCNFLAGHEDESAQPDHHSWHDVRCQDLIDANTRIDYTPQAVQAFLDSMTRGEMDAYLEAILAVGHNRKRARRGTPGFTH